MKTPPAQGDGGVEPRGSACRVSGGRGVQAPCWPALALIHSS